jgi:four helix bundle protein
MENKNNRENKILDLTLEFSLLAIAYCESLEEKKRFVIANQLLKSATSIGANIFEAQNAESRADFIHKIKIAAKESEETKYWLTLCERAKSYSNPSELIEKRNIIEKVINRILGTAKKNLKN